MWNNYLIVSGLDSKPDRYVTALLLHSICKDALCVYNGMQFDDEDRDNPEKIIEMFDEYVLGETKEFFERFKFNRRYLRPVSVRTEKSGKVLWILQLHEGKAFGG